ncbi:MAG: tyrosine-protein phosphatase [Caldilineaceae bacterium]
MPSNTNQWPLHLDWPTCYNIRDLGGLPTTNGGLTRRGAFIRADTPARLTDEGRQMLLDYGVRTIIDLRAPIEAAEYPSPFANQSAPHMPAYLNLPLEKFYPHVGQMIVQAEHRAQVYCIMLDHYPDCMADVMRAMLNAAPGPILFHCHSGKDRTGTVAALLLGLAGVPDELIAADYALSQERLMPVYKQDVQRAGGEDKVGFWGRLTVTEEMMYYVLAHLQSRYGGVRAYLQQAGLREPELDGLAARMLESTT